MILSESLAAVMGEKQVRVIIFSDPGKEFCLLHLPCSTCIYYLDDYYH